MSIPPGNTVAIKLTQEPTQLTGFEIVEQIPPGFVLVNITDRGVVYYPPRTHFNQPIGGDDPLVVAEAGLRFYESFVLQLSEAFSAELDTIPSPHPGALPPDRAK